MLAPTTSVTAQSGWPWEPLRIWLQSLPEDALRAFKSQRKRKEKDNPTYNCAMRFINSERLSLWTVCYKRVSQSGPGVVPVPGTMRGSTLLEVYEICEGQKEQLRVKRRCRNGYVDVTYTAEEGA